MLAAVTDDLELRRASTADIPKILELASRALGWTDDNTAFFTWKHLENSFGASPMWVAESEGRVVGFRTFLRWELTTPEGRVLRAVRAVDTATDPAFQGKGIFTKLTLAAIDELRDDGVDLVFNTPNDKSRPGYLKMGWTQVGQLPVEVRPNAWRFPVAIAGARQSADRAAVDTNVGERAVDVLADVQALAPVLDASAPRGGLATHRTPAHLAWRYGNAELAYRAAVAGSVARGVAFFRLRRRGSAVEAVVGDVIVRDGDDAAERELLGVIASARADYLIRLGRAGRLVAPREMFVRLPRVGPLLVCRPLDGSPPPPLDAWALDMGDIELL
jgi:GNAT superfamily N-acetyltransferase